MRRFFLVTAIFLFLFCFSRTFVFALADLPVSISEIMYDLKSGTDTGHEWVEIENRGDVPVSLSGFQLLDSSKNVLENHEPIRSVQGGEAVLPRGYAVIASNAKKFLADNSGFSGVLFASSFSLSNSGEVLVLKDKVGNEIDRILYMSSWGGAGDGNSIQRYSQGWRAGIPSPGSAEKPPVATPIIQVVSQTVKKTTGAPVYAKKNTEVKDPLQPPSSTPAVVSSLAAVGNSALPESNSFRWILGFFGFLVLSVVGYLFVSKDKNPIDEIEIID